MSDRTGNEGIEAFCNWFKERVDESESATQWKIPNKCIPDSKMVCLTVEEAKGVAETYDALASFLIKCMDGDGAKEAIAFAIELNKRIEQAESKCSDE